MHLSDGWDDDGMQAMVGISFGKTLLFTDRPDWSDEQIIAASRGQSKVEDAFNDEGPPLRQLASAPAFGPIARSRSTPRTGSSPCC